MSAPNTVSIRQTIERDVYVQPDDLASFCAAMRQVGIEVMAVDDQDVIGLCESCAIPILHDEEYSRDDEDGIVLCKACGDELAKSAHDALIAALSHMEADNEGRNDCALQTVARKAIAAINAALKEAS